MQKYFAVFKAGLLDAVEYRTEFFTSVLSWGIRLVISLFLWFAVAQTKGSIGPYSFSSILLYFFVTQIISSLVFSRVAFTISQEIHYGDFSNYLVKPVSYPLYHLSSELSQNVFRTLLGMLIFGTILFFIDPSFYALLIAHPLHLVLFLVSLIFAYIINFCLVIMIAFLSFWILNAHRFTFMYFGILTIFSGLLLPLDLFPKVFYDLLIATPLPYIFFFPAKILQALPSISRVFLTILLPQAIFALLLPLFVKIIFWFGVKKFEAVGR